LPEIREAKTLNALAALCKETLISTEQYAALSEAYIFLRDVENKLQMVNDAQTHSIPRDREELNTTARLLGYSDADHFLRDYQHHTATVNAIFARFVQ
jgi:glutamate-ammonia-ligase adenylyltransferase